MTRTFSGAALVALMVSQVAARAAGVDANPRWRTFDVAVELTEQDSRSSAGPRLRYAPVRAFDFGEPRLRLLLAPTLSFSVLKTASSGKIGALSYGAALGAALDDTWDARWNLTAASWSGSNGTAFSMGPEFGYRLHRDDWAAAFDRVFVAVNFLKQRPYVRQYLIGLQFQF